MRTIIFPTAQNIELEYPVAAIWERALARLIDVLLQIGYIFLLIKIQEEARFTFSQNTFIMLLLPVFLYTLGSEILFSGQTLGKKIRNLRVIRKDGSAPTWSDLFIRWVFFIIEGPASFFGMVAFVFLAATQKGQRLGDLAAGTVVIKEELVVDFDDTMFRNISEQYELRFPQIEMLSDKDIAILNNIFADGLKNKNLEMLARLSTKVKTVTGIETQLSDETFLEIVLRDYNYLYGKK